MPSLAPGGASAGSVTVTVPSSTVAGIYYLIACADDTKVAAESNETNNCATSTGTVQISAPSLPDLIESSLADPPASAALGSGFSVTDTVLNQGAATATASTTRYYLSLDAVKSTNDKLLTGTRAVPTLTAGASSTGSVTVTVPTSTVAGNYYLMACADDRRRVTESSETNNCKASTGKVSVVP